MNGSWVEAPVVDFFNTLLQRFPQLPVIAEDLGIITPEVREVMQRYGLPGMKVLQFAFSGDAAQNPYLPHNIDRNSIIYTGTHDNNTTRGWFENDASPEERARLEGYLGRKVPSGDIPWEMMRIAMMSVANTCITPVQDLLALGQEARMNVPATRTGNWRWRLEPGRLHNGLAERLRSSTAGHRIGKSSARSMHTPVGPSCNLQYGVVIC